MKGVKTGKLYSGSEVVQLIVRALQFGKSEVVEDSTLSDVEKKSVMYAYASGWLSSEFGCNIPLYHQIDDLPF